MNMECSWLLRTVRQQQFRKGTAVLDGEVTWSIKQVSLFVFYVHFTEVEVHFLCESGYIVPCVGSFTEEKFCLSLNLPPVCEYQKYVENKIK
jgi:hypothetical protein